MPERLKTLVDEAAAREGLSANAWLVRMVGAAVDGARRRHGGSSWAAKIGQSYVGGVWFGVIDGPARIKSATAAWLDAKALLGSVRNGLTGSDGEPVAAQEKVQLRARTRFGSIDVHRA